MAESQREESKMASLQTDAWYLSLLGLAENFRTSNPPNIKLCIHCLQTIFTFKPSPRIEARTHLQLGSILYTHTKNSDLARMHLEQAWALSQSIQSFEEVKFEAASLLGQLYEKQNRLGDAKPVIRKAVEISAQSPYWHCRLLFQLAQIHSIQRDYTAACSILGLGADYAGTKKAEYTKTLFLLTKGMWLMPYRDLNDCFTVLLFPISAESKFRLVVQYICMSMVLLHCTALHSTPLPQEGKDIAIFEGVQRSYLAFILTLLLIDKRLSDVHDVLGTAGRMVEDWTSPNHSQQESLKVFFLVLQVCHYLMAGQVKSVKPALKQLQQSIQTITSVHADDDPVQNSPPAVDNFQWLPKEHMCVLVYLVTVMHSMQAGYMDKAEKYTAKALMQIEKLKMLDSHPLLSSFQLMLLEHIIMCRLIMGNKTRAIQEISEVCHVCQQQPRLFSKHGAQIHTLLGLYAMSMNCMEAAEAQFKTALSKSSERELWTFVNLNLAIVYLRSNRQTDLLALLERIDPDAMTTCSHSLRASAFYVQGLQSFFQARYNEAKRYLRETLKMANAEDLNRLTSCSLVLLGHIFLSLGNSQEALNMVTPAMQLAGKIPDVHVQLWASALLKDVYRLCGNPQGEAEGFRLHDTFSQSLLKDHFQSSQQSEHKLIQWTEGPCPFEFGSSSSVTDGDLL